MDLDYDRTTAREFRSGIGGLFALTRDLYYRFVLRELVNGQDMCEFVLPEKYLLFCQVRCSGRSTFALSFSLS